MSFFDLFKRGDYIKMTKEELKIQRLTQANTMVNRDKLDKIDTYIKNMKNDYKDIYGNKGIKFCNDMQNITRQSQKKKNKVSFSNKIEYSKS